MCHLLLTPRIMPHTEPWRISTEVYSPECVEGKFCDVELRVHAVLRSPPHTTRRRRPAPPRLLADRTVEIARSVYCVWLIECDYGGGVGEEIVSTQRTTYQARARSDGLQLLRAIDHTQAHGEEGARAYPARAAYEAVLDLGSARYEDAMAYLM